MQAEPDDPLGRHRPEPHPHHRVAGPLPPVGEERAGLDRRGGGGPSRRPDRCGRDHPGDRGGLGGGLEQRDAPAHRAADEDRRSSDPLGQERGQQPAIGRKGRASVAARGRAGARQIDGDRGPELGERGCDRQPVHVRSAQSVQQHERALVRTLPPGVMDGNVELADLVRGARRDRRAHRGMRVRLDHDGPRVPLPAEWTPPRISTSSSSRVTR